MSNTTISPSVGAVTMGGVAPTAAVTAVPVITRNNDGTWDVTWQGITAGAVGALFGARTYRAAFLQIEGVFGSGGSCQVEGSNDGQNIHKLSPSAVTSAGFAGPLESGEHPKYLRPNCTAGDNTTNLTVTARID